MKIEFNYIKNKIAKFRKNDILDLCYIWLEKMERDKEKLSPVWNIFTLMKWTYIYAEKKYPYKQFQEVDFLKLLSTIFKFNDEHISDFFKNHQIDKGFMVLYNQQFYLQKTVYKEIFATQLKLFTKLQSRYDIDKAFKDKTGLGIRDFIFLKQLVWIYFNSDKLSDEQFSTDIDEHFINLVSQASSHEKLLYFLKTLTLNPDKILSSIERFKHGQKNEYFQTMEISFFTMYPFQFHRNKLRLVHKSIYDSVANYFIYDYMKQNDEKFTTEFGIRMEKFIQLGLEEMKMSFKTENDLRKELGKTSKVVDFLITDENILIESKAIELHAYPSVNPTDEIIFSSLKDSLFKAYFEQMLHVSKKLNTNSVNWGIIITYKEIFWNHFIKLFEIGKGKYPHIQDFSCLPPENVFIIDIYTWNHVVQIVKEKKATLLEILALAKDNNSKSETSKQLFEMHLDDYDVRKYNLSYLEKEFKELELA